MIGTNLKSTKKKMTKFEPIKIELYEKPDAVNHLNNPLFMHI